MELFNIRCCIELSGRALQATRYTQSTLLYLTLNSLIHTMFDILDIQRNRQGTQYSTYNLTLPTPPRLPQPPHPPHPISIT